MDESRVRMLMGFAVLLFAAIFMVGHQANVDDAPLDLAYVTGLSHMRENSGTAAWLFMTTSAGALSASACSCHMTVCLFWRNRWAIFRCCLARPKPSAERAERHSRHTH